MVRPGGQETQTHSSTHNFLFSSSFSFFMGNYIPAAYLESTLRDIPENTWHTQMLPVEGIVAHLRMPNLDRFLNKGFSRDIKDNIREQLVAGMEPADFEANSCTYNLECNHFARMRNVERLAVFYEREIPEIKTCVYTY